MFWKVRQTDGNTGENNDHYYPGLWVGRMDKKRISGLNNSHYNSSKFDFWMHCLCNTNSGECNGRFVTDNYTTSVEECVFLCEKYDDCNVWTYYNLSGICILTMDCIFFDNVSCTECYTGERDCVDRKKTIPIVFNGGLLYSYTYSYTWYI